MSTTITKNAKRPSDSGNLVPADVSFIIDESSRIVAVADRTSMSVFLTIDLDSLEHIVEIGKIVAPFRKK